MDIHEMVNLITDIQKWSQGSLVVAFSGSTLTLSWGTTSRQRPGGRSNWKSQTICFGMKELNNPNLMTWFARSSHIAGAPSICCKLLPHAGWRTGDCRHPRLPARRHGPSQELKIGNQRYEESTIDDMDWWLGNFDIQMLIFAHHLRMKKTECLLGSTKKMFWIQYWIWHVPFSNTWFPKSKNHPSKSSPRPHAKWCGCWCPPNWPKIFGNTQKWWFF